MAKFKYSEKISKSHEVTDYTKKKISVGRKQRKVTCTRCSMEGGISNMKRYHFNNCKINISEETKKKYLKGTNNKTLLQEVGVVIAIDSLLYSGEVLNLETYKPSDKVKSHANISIVLNFLKENKSWLKSVNNSALAIVNKFGDETLKKYTIHHNDELYKLIRHIGKKLSGLSSKDRWNPSDFYFIKKFNIDEI